MLPSDRFFSLSAYVLSTPGSSPSKDASNEFQLLVGL